MWAVAGGIALSTIIAVLIDARFGCLALATVLFVAGVCRALISGPGPVGLTIRTKPIDVGLFWTLAMSIGVLAVLTPGV